MLERRSFQQWNPLALAVGLAFVVAGCGGLVESDDELRESGWPTGYGPDVTPGDSAWPTGQGPDFLPGEFEDGISYPALDTSCPLGTWDDDGDAHTDCVPYTDCLLTEYEAVPPGQTNDRLCSVVTACALGQEQTAAATYTANTVCRDCVAGEYCAGGTDPAVDCFANGSYNTDPTEMCTPWTECPEGEGEVVAPTGTSDRMCEAGLWTDQFGTSGDDSADSVTVDGNGNIYVAGYTEGNLDGESTGYTDAFVHKYNSDGTLLWADQFGSTTGDYARSATVDANGNIYVVGLTFGDLEGEGAGSADAFVRKYNAAGMALWTTQFGTGSFEHADSVTVDGNGNIYVAGWTFGDLEGESAGGDDAFVRKYNAAGTMLWTRQFGTTAADWAWSVTADGSGNIYVAGQTGADLEGEGAGYDDAFVRKYNAAGTVLWTRQFGTGSGDYAHSVTVDASGNIYVAGYTLADLKGESAGAGDAYVRKYNATGTVLWTRQFGTTGGDNANSVTVDGSGNIYVAGSTSGDLVGENAGDGDAFVRKYDAAGTVLWTDQFGTSGYDYAESVAVDGSSNIYVAGRTEGDLAGESAGDRDAFVKLIAP